MKEQLHLAPGEKKIDRDSQQKTLSYLLLLPSAQKKLSHQHPIQCPIHPTHPTRFVLHRFMRVLTTTLPVASEPAQLYASCDADATACLVVHKAAETAADRGAVAARQMLFDCERACGPGAGALL